MSKELMEMLAKEVKVNVLKNVDLFGRKVGLVIVDEVNGFVTPGMGALAPPAPDAVIHRMVVATHKLAVSFIAAQKKVLVFNERHEPDVPEPPYPLHCVRGTGEEIMPDLLAPLYKSSLATIVYKNCINGFVGAIRPNGSNAVVDWINDNQLDTVVVVGICTDICVMQFVQTLLSARNKRFDDGSAMMPTLQDVVVCTDACSTYDLPMAVAKNIPGLTESDAHPRELTEFIGRYLMQRSGAILTETVSL